MTAISLAQLLQNMDELILLVSTMLDDVEQEVEQGKSHAATRRAAGKGSMERRQPARVRLRV